MHAYIYIYTHTHTYISRPPAEKDTAEAFKKKTLYVDEVARGRDLLDKRRCKDGRIHTHTHTHISLSPSLYVYMCVYMYIYGDSVHGRRPRAPACVGAPVEKDTAEAFKKKTLYVDEVARGRDLFETKTL